MLKQVNVPTELTAAFSALASSRASAILSGGTLLMPEINTKVTGIDTLVSIRALGLDGISVEGSKARVGAGVTLDALGRDKRFAVINGVIETIASPPVRNMATVGGNLFAAQPYGDLAVALLALGAEVEIASADGTRVVPVDEIIGRGVAAGEIVTSISFDIPQAGDWFYLKAMRRKSNSAAVVSVAAVVKKSGDVVESARVALGGCGASALRAASVETALVGKPLDAASVTAAAEAAAGDVQPFTDAYATAWYRRRVLPVYIRRALLGA